MVKALIVRRMPDNEKIADFRICTKEVHWKTLTEKDFRICTKEVYGKNQTEKRNSKLHEQSEIPFLNNRLVGEKT